MDGRCKVTLTIGQIRRLIRESRDGEWEGSIEESPLDGLRKDTAKRRVYKAIGDFGGFFRDDNWSHVTEIFNRMKDAGFNVFGGAVNDNRHSGGYFRNDRGHIAGKEWSFGIDFFNEKGRPTRLEGRIVASFGGSVEQMENDYLGEDRPYDLCVYFTN